MATLYIKYAKKFFSEIIGGGHGLFWPGGGYAHEYCLLLAFFDFSFLKFSKK